jgi:hypothetical protein
MRLRSLLLCTTAAVSLTLGSFACSSDKASPPPVDVDKDGVITFAELFPEREEQAMVAYWLLAWLVIQLQ